MGRCLQYINLIQKYISLEKGMRKCTCILYNHSCVIDFFHANMLPGSWRATTSFEHGCRPGPNFSSSIHKDWEYHRQQWIAYEYQCLKSDVDSWVGPKIKLKLKLKARDCYPNCIPSGFPSHSLSFLAQRPRKPMFFFHWVMWVEGKC